MRRTERQPVTGDNNRQLVAQFYKTYFKGIYRFIFRLTGDADETRDVTQEVFIKLFDYLNRKGEIMTPKAWLYRVAVNTCHSHLRRQAKFRQIVARELEDGHPAGANGQARDVEEELIKREERHMIRRAFNRLAVRDRIALELFHSGLSYAEMAAVLKVNQSSVGKILFRARHRLARLIRQGEGS